MKQDRFLIVILGVIGFLVVLAVVLFFVRQEPQNYGSNDTPDGVVRNYCLALQKSDYQSAYEHLQNTENKPDFITFQQTFLRNEADTTQSAIQLGAVEISGDNARVTLTIIHNNNNDPFNRTWDENGTALLTQQDGKWRILSMPYPYWGWDWYIEK